jgi:hypothetical protein
MLYRVVVLPDLSRRLWVVLHHGDARRRGKLMEYKTPELRNLGSLTELTLGTMGSNVDGRGGSLPDSTLPGGTGGGTELIL